MRAEMHNYIYNSSHLFPLLTVELACASSPVGREFAASPSPYSRACFRILSRWSSLLAHPRRRIDLTGQLFISHS
uniref:Uncharacterized protein n=1 Tax=Picea glauca TaxID=3330 RepID=A0A117NGG0_PICGL|nr:hypothetical protein ABT39_MTgene1344 [Picea glauca]KUM46746.1 hypothetical protein ABT39_MTgene1426 [Picea glauca]KUM46747.1 hypothetical protein ABT39_MTgene1427 [Picea glauca]